MPETYWRTSCCRCEEVRNSLPLFLITAFSNSVLVLPSFISTAFHSFSVCLARATAACVSWDYHSLFLSVVSLFIHSQVILEW